MRLRSWSTNALALDDLLGAETLSPRDGLADLQVAELGLENDTEALAFAEQVRQLLSPNTCTSALLSVASHRLRTVDLWMDEHDGCGAYSGLTRPHLEQAQTG